MGKFFQEKKIDNRKQKGRDLLKIGIALLQIGEQATRENVIKLSIGAERESFDSLWVNDKVNDRMIWPQNPLVPSPVTPD